MLEIQVVYKGKAVIRFSRDMFLQKFENYYKGDKGLLIEAFNAIESDIKKELLKL